jgi:hypothetical protein
LWSIHISNTTKCIETLKYKIIILILLSKYGEKDFFMPRGQLTKDEMKYQVLKLKQKLQTEQIGYTSDPKALADKYLNEVLDKIEEYRV